VRNLLRWESLRRKNCWKRMKQRVVMVIGWKVKIFGVKNSRVLQYLLSFKNRILQYSAS
jgi:hypothetical protein